MAAIPVAAPYGGGSAVPYAVNNFMVLMAAVLPQGSTVELAQPVPKYTSPLTLRITGVSGDQEWKELGPSFRREEQFNILCELSKWEGDQDFLARMNEVYAAFETVTVAIGNDPQLTGTPDAVFDQQGSVRLAEVRNLLYVPAADAPGMSLGKLTFDVYCQQRITTLT